MLLCSYHGCVGWRGGWGIVFSGANLLAFLGQARTQMYKILGRARAKRPNGFEPKLATEGAEAQGPRVRGRGNTKVHWDPLGLPFGPFWPDSGKSGPGPELLVMF